MTKNFDFFIHCPALPKGYACGFAPSGRHRSLHCARQPRNAAGFAKGSKWRCRKVKVTVPESLNGDAGKCMS